MWHSSLFQVRLFYGLWLLYQAWNYLSSKKNTRERRWWRWWWNKKAKVCFQIFILPRSEQWLWEVLARPPTLFISSHLCCCLSIICLFIGLFYRHPAAAVLLSRCLQNWQLLMTLLKCLFFHSAAYFNRGFCQILNIFHTRSWINLVC